MSSIPHMIRLKDGSLCNLDKRSAKRGVSLLACLRTVPDPRKAQGKRHELALVLFILLRGSRTLKDAHLWAMYSQPLLAQYFSVAHGIPDPTTLSSVLQVVEPDDLVTAFTTFSNLLGINLGTVYSFDGKTMRAVSREAATRHILSFFSHGTQLALGQVGVNAKENEIPAFERLLAQGSTHNLVAGTLLIGDALHTQKATCKLILKHEADYLFTVKNNQRLLKRTIATELDRRHPAAPSPAPSVDTHTGIDTTRGREVRTTVTLVTATDACEELLPALTGSNHGEGVRTIGLLHRTGTRKTKDGTVHEIDETIGFIASRTLTAKEVATHLHNHWCIENNLHWVKDEVFGEDKHTLRLGNAPQVMSYLLCAMH